MHNFFKTWFRGIKNLTIICLWLLSMVSLFIYFIGGFIQGLIWFFNTRCVFECEAFSGWQKTWFISSMVIMFLWLAYIVGENSEEAPTSFRNKTNWKKNWPWGQSQT